VDPLSVVGCDEEELRCVLIPFGFNDQPLSSPHEEVRKRPALMKMIPKSRRRGAFIGG
jgi:hypothetical protein